MYVRTIKHFTFNFKNKQVTSFDCILKTKAKKNE